jgi:hypothetical protein
MMAANRMAWIGGSFAKTRALVDTFVSTTENQFPALRNYEYDFRTNNFVDANGRPVSGGRFSEGAKSGVARGARAGSSTLRAAILAKSLASSESGQRPGILEKVLRGSRALVTKGGLDTLFSRATPQQQVSYRSSRRYETALHCIILAHIVGQVGVRHESCHLFPCA